MTETVAVLGQAPAKQSRLRFILILGTLAGLAPLSIDMYLAAFPVIATEFHTGASEVQLSLTACTVGLAIGQLVAGPLSDTLGRRRPLFFGLTLFLVTSVLCAFAPSVTVLIALRFLQGFGGAAGLVISRAVVRDLYSGIALARFFSMLMLVTGMAPILAPLLGGQLLRVTSWHGVFAVLGCVGVLLLAAVVFGLPETLEPARRQPGSLSRSLRVFGGLLRDRMFVGYALSAALSFAALFAYVSGSSFVLQDAFGLSPQAFTLVFGANSLGIMVVGQINGRLVGRVSARTLLATGIGTTAVGGVSVLLAAITGVGLVGMLPALFVVAASLGLVFPNATALALSGHPETAGSASALLGVIQFLSGGIAAPLAGAGGSGTAVPMGVVMAAAALGGVLVFATFTRPRRGSGEGEGPGVEVREEAVLSAELRG